MTLSTFLIIPMNLNSIRMSIVTSANITDEHRRFIDEKSINFSKFVRKAIDREMELDKD